MPLYDYKCRDCGKTCEIRHGFDEANAAPCPACGGTLVRVFNPAPIVFKGSGFYVTDSRRSGPANASASDGPKSDGAKSDDAKADGASNDAPKADAPTTGASKTAAPKADAPGTGSASSEPAA